LVSTPSIIPPGGSSSGPQQVSISTTTTGASIYYTTNGTTPNQNSTPYSGIFTLNNSATVKAKAYKAGHTPSDVATAQFTIQQLQLLPPTFYPDPNVEYGGSVGVSIQTSLPLTRVRYTTNGTEPNDTDSNLFEGDPITLLQDTTIKAKIFRDGFTPSDTVTANYTVLPSADTPIITPNGGNHSGSVEVSLTLPAKAASSPSEFMYYTTNGADPETFSTRYTTPFTLGIGTHTVKARTIYPGLPPSTIAQAQFTVYNPSPTLQSPVFKPVQGSHANSVQVSLESLTEGAQIRYTIGDNMAPADPTSNTGTVYSGPFNLGMTTNPGDRWFIRAKAFKSPDESAVIQKNYEIFTPLGDINPPVFDPLPVEGEYFYNPVTVNLSATTDPPTTGIQVYRTTNGDEPIVPDPPGVGQTSVNLTGSTYLKAIAYRAFFGSSDVTSASYNFKCATPTITAQTTKGVNHIASVTVVMDSTTTGGTTKIRYEMGGIEPDENSTEYTSPIVLGVGTHIFKARTYRNDFETSDLAVASFIVEETPEAPMITLDPMDMEVDQYTDVTFTASAIGIPTPEYQWRFNGTPLAGETLGELYIPNVQPGHAGQYNFVASNSTSSATSTAATLTVNQVASPTPTDTL
ncbi:MAG: chitobiase/beta-hexosaminidase C-terminal domain-containing protein, partial [Candidatus Omnitrophica bacterium]|nr:chitobiase/beta-hexosaminidase C-terminal domain-containing protein [Candidatus Omnitrophota bacterium]